MTTPRVINKRTVQTECCGRIKRCRWPKKCCLNYQFAGGGKCVRCGWIWDMMPGRDATPISAKEMLKAHTGNPKAEPLKPKKKLTPLVPIDFPYRYLRLTDPALIADRGARGERVSAIEVSKTGNIDSWFMGNLPDGHRCAIRRSATLGTSAEIDLDGVDPITTIEARVVDGPNGPVITFKTP